MVLKEKNGMKYLTFERLESEEFSFVKFAVSTRHGGVSEGDALGTLNMGSNTPDTKGNRVENYKRFCGALGFETKNVVLGKQTHSSNVRLVTKADCGKGVFIERDYDDVDALITNVPDIPLVIHTADCVPVTLIDKKNRALGNAHCGWRGTFSCLGEETLNEMKKNFGTAAEDVTAIIGPCIHSCCYEVSEDLYQKFLEKFGNKENKKLIFERKGRFYLDLPGINRFYLEKAGVCDIMVSDICTCCNKELLYSHRGLGAGRGVFGTFASLV